MQNTLLTKDSDLTKPPQYQHSNYSHSRAADEVCCLDTLCLGTLARKIKHEFLIRYNSTLYCTA